MSSEQRKYIRIEKKHLLSHEKYSFRAQTEKKKFEGSLKNYSAGGALFESREKYNLGDILKLEVGIPGWEKFKSSFFVDDLINGPQPIIALASVVRMEVIVPEKLYEVGVCFVGIDNGHQWALMKQIKAQVEGRK